MLRFLLLAAGLVAAFVWIEPEWIRSDRTLKLRVRQPDEIVAYATAGVRQLAQRALEETRGEPEGERSAERNERRLQPVGAGPARLTTRSQADLEIPPERLTRAERERLSRLIEEKLRQP